jgi:hypothetical protein
MIINDLVSMHNILAKVISSDHMVIVYQKIINHIKETLFELYSQVELTSVVPAQRI